MRSFLTETSRIAFKLKKDIFKSDKFKACFHVNDFKIHLHHAKVT